MNLHLLRGMWWKIVCIPSGSFITVRRYCTIRAVRRMLWELTYSKLYTRLLMVHLLRESSQGFTWYCHHIQSINLASIWLLLRVRQGVYWWKCWCMACSRIMWDGGRWTWRTLSAATTGRLCCIYGQGYFCPGHHITGPCMCGESLWPLVPGHC